MVLYAGSGTHHMLVLPLVLWHMLLPEGLRLQMLSAQPGKPELAELCWPQLGTHNVPSLSSNCTRVVPESRRLLL